MNRIYPLIAVFLGLCLSCDQQKRFSQRMEGSWEIIQEEIILIKRDGNTELLSDKENVGSLLLSDPGFGDTFLDYTLRIEGTTYPWNQLPFKTDEERKRVFFYNFFCADLFGCDFVGTILEDKVNRQRWQFIRPSGDDHRRITWTLERD